jgi:hypothetical protein
MSGHPITPDAPDDDRVWWLPNGRYVFRLRDGSGYLVQPPNDNWSHIEPTIEAAVTWFDAYGKEPA